VPSELQGAYPWIFADGEDKFNPVNPVASLKSEAIGFKVGVPLFRIRSSPLKSGGEGFEKLWRMQP
jgi:hypothetical protein